MESKMINTYNTAKLVGVAVLGIAAGTVADKEHVILKTAQIGTITIDEATRVPLGPAVAVVVALLGCAWYIGSWKQSLSDQMEDLKKGQDLLSKRLDKLPCTKTGEECDKPQ